MNQKWLNHEIWFSSISSQEATKAHSFSSLRSPCKPIHYCMQSPITQTQLVGKSFVLRTWKWPSSFFCVFSPSHTFASSASWWRGRRSVAVVEALTRFHIHLNLIFFFFPLSLLHVCYSAVLKPPHFQFYQSPPLLSCNGNSHPWHSSFTLVRPNTLRDSEWGTGEADPSLFNPTSLNTIQWVQVAKDAGFNRVMLTAVLFMA